MRDVVLDGENGRRLLLCLASRRDSEAIWTYMATLSIAEGEASTIVHDHGDRLGPFLRDVADAWRGFDGVKEYVSLEGQLHLRCRHDGIGTVECVVRLRQPWPPEWTLEASLLFGAGAHPRTPRC